MDREALIKYYTSKLENPDLTQLSRSIAQDTLHELNQAENLWQLIQKFLEA